MPCNNLSVLSKQLHGTQIRPYYKKVKDHPSLIILTNLVDFESPMLYTIARFSLKAFLVLEKKILSVLPYMGMTAILFTDAEPFEQSVNIPSTEGLMWNLVRIGQVVSEKMFKDLMVLYLYIAQGQGQITPGEGGGGRGANFWS